MKSSRSVQKKILSSSCLVTTTIVRVPQTCATTKALADNQDQSILRYRTNQLISFYWAGSVVFVVCVEKCIVDRYEEVQHALDRALHGEGSPTLGQSKVHKSYVR